MSEFEQVEQPVDDKFKDRLKKAGCDEDKDVFDEGIFVSESNGEEDDEEDDNDFLRQPKTEFEKNLLRINNITQQIDEDTQFLSHDMKTLQSKNVSTERRIVKLLRDVEEFKYKLQAFLQSFTGRQVEQRRNDEKSEPASPGYHKATLNVLLKQNSIEQPVHVNIAVR